MSAPQWFGRAGHLCVADRCRFHLHTHVGEWCISTVGDYYPKTLHGEDDARVPEQIGWGRLYETMVFRTLGGYPIDAGSPVEMHGYNDAASAERGHMDMVTLYQVRP